MSKYLERKESSQSTDRQKVACGELRLQLRLLGDVVVRHQSEEEEARAEEAGGTQVPVERVMVSVWFTLGLLRMLSYDEEYRYNTTYQVLVEVSPY